MLVIVENQLIQTDFIYNIGEIAEQLKLNKDYPSAYLQFEIHFLNDKSITISVDNFNPMEFNSITKIDEYQIKLDEVRKIEAKNLIKLTKLRNDLISFLNVGEGEIIKFQIPSDDAVELDSDEAFATAKIEAILCITENKFNEAINRIQRVKEDFQK